MFACRVCGADSRDEVCPDCRKPFTTPAAIESDATESGAAEIQPYDAVRSGYANLITDMTREELAHQAVFLHKLAWDRGEELRAANDRADNAEWEAARNRTLIDGHQRRYDALVETMRRMGEEGESAKQIVALVRELRDECQQNGIGKDDLPLRLMALFGALMDYDAEVR